MERARRWGRALNTIDRAPGRLFVDGQQVWRVDDPAQTGSWLVGALDTAPSSGVSVGSADVVRLRDAVTALERARDLPSLLTKGLPPLARFRDVKIDQLLQAGHRRLECLNWATSDPAMRSPSPPLRVLTPALPRDLRSMLRHARIALPPLPHHLATDLFDQDLAIAARLAQWDLAGVAESWLRTAAAVWWPPSIHIETVDGFFEQLVGRPGDAVSIARSARSHATREGFYGTVPAGLSDLNDIRAALHALLYSGSDEDPQAWRPPCIELHLAAPTIPGLSSACRPDRVGAAAQDLRAVVSITWREQVGPAVPAVLEEHWFPRWVTNLPASLAARALAQWPVPEISWDHRLLDRYLRLLEDGPRTDSEEGRFLRTRVVAELCNTTAEWARLGGLAGLDVRGMEDLVAALAISQAPGSGHLREQLAVWSAPRLLDPGTDVTGAASMLDISQDQLVAYLHYRRLAGEGEQLPADLRRSTDTTRESRQIDAMLMLLKDPELPAERREILQRQVQRLRNDAANTQRRAAQSRRAARTLPERTAELRTEALRRILESVAATTTTGLSTAALIQVTGLQAHRDADPDVVGRFVDTLAKDEPLARWPENRRWLALASKHFDVDRWQSGFSVEVNVDGRTFRYVTESDPIRALRMGTYFSTCLTVPGGLNAPSALTNVVDANKHVVYGLDTDGNIVARKLIAVSTDWKLLGYETFVFEDRWAHEGAIDQACREFARSCGLELTDDGEPATLAGSFWYDDGAERWRSDVPIRSFKEVVSALVERYIEDPVAHGDDDDPRVSGLRALTRHRDRLTADDIDEIQTSLTTSRWLSMQAAMVYEQFLLALSLDGTIRLGEHLTSLLVDRRYFPTLLIPLVEPAHFRHAIIARPNVTADHDNVHSRPTRPDVNASLRIAAEPGNQHVLHALPPEHAARILASASFRDLSVVRLVALKGGVLRWDARDGRPGELEFAAASDAALRDRLHGTAADARGAARELLRRPRRQHNSLAVAAAAERNPDDHALAAYAICLGYDLPRRWSSGELSVDKHLQAMLRHIRPDLIQQQQGGVVERQPAEGPTVSAAEVAHAVANAAAGDWSFIQELALVDRTVTAHPDLEGLVVAALLDADPDELIELAPSVLETVDGPLRAYRGDVLVMLAMIGHEVSPDRLRRALTRRTWEAVWFLDGYPAGAVSQIAELLSEEHHLALLIDITRGRCPDQLRLPIVWTLAKRISHDDYIRLATTPDATAVLIDVAVRCCVAETASRLITSMLHAHNDEIDQFVEIVMEPSWSRALDVEAAAAIRRFLRASGLQLPATDGS